MKKLLILLSLCLLPFATFAQKTLPKGWRTNQYYSSIERVWDTSVLPACLPAPPEGIKVESTMYKSKEQKTMGSMHVGDMLFYNDNYEKYSVAFLCNQPQYDAYVSALKNTGFIGYKEKGNPISYSFAGNGYYVYLEFRNYAPTDGYDGTATLVIVPDDYEKPATFCGFPLPQCGMLNKDVINETSLCIYTDDGNNEIPYNVKSDSSIADKVGNNEFFIAFDLYMGVSEKEAGDYFDAIDKAGYQKKYKTDDESDITALFKSKNGNMVIGVRYAKNYHCLEVQASKSDDYLFN